MSYIPELGPHTGMPKADIEPSEWQIAVMHELAEKGLVAIVPTDLSEWFQFPSGAIKDDGVEAGQRYKKFPTVWKTKLTETLKGMYELQRVDFLANVKSYIASEMASLAEKIKSGKSFAQEYEWRCRYQALATFSGMLAQIDRPQAHK